MRKLIKQALDKDLQVLNTNLVKGNNHDQLLIVLAMIVKAINGTEPYVNAMSNMYEAYPSLNWSNETKGAISEIIFLIAGNHSLITQCFEEEKGKEKSIFSYSIDLTDEIVDNLTHTYAQFLSNNEDGSVVINDTQLPSRFSTLELSDVGVIGSDV